MAFRWRADDCPTLNAGLVALWFFRITRKPYEFVIFSEGVLWIRQWAHMSTFTFSWSPAHHYPLIVSSCSGAGNVCFVRRSCTSGYTHETFRLCSSNLSCKYFLVSYRNIFPISWWLKEISKWLPNSYVKLSAKWQKEGTRRYKRKTW